jgi:hypothetical protein
VRLTAAGAEVQGVIGTNQTGEDGAYLYFVADGVLAGNANEAKEKAVGGQPNLYLIHEHATSFIATLSTEDDSLAVGSDELHPGGDWRPNLGLRTAAVSPDGRHLVFESVRPLTGYNNANPPNVVTEVFVYSADDSQLVCPSCNPTGQAPTVNPEAASVGSGESRLPVSFDSSTYQRRVMSDDGDRVFFDSEQPLLPQDTNGTQDVYEWEREGSGSCTKSTPERTTHGCVYLLTGGSNRGFSFLVDSDTTGDNVFIEHQGSLGHVQAPEDRNELYDVRVAGGFPTTVTGCAGASCPSSPAPPPSFLTSSATLSAVGGGNFVPQRPPTSKPPLLTRKRKLAKARRACRRKPRRSRPRCDSGARRASQGNYARKGK